jgi:type III secretion protein J
VASNLGILGHAGPDKRARRAVVGALCAVLLCACSGSIDLHSGLSERDANEIVAALLDSGLSSEKLSSKQGFVVRVSGSDLATAIAVLRARGLPRSTFARMGDVFKKDGMISTPIEERGRYVYALSQEIENTLSQIDGVVLARVHPVLAERVVPGEPVQSSSCAVFIKHRPDWDSSAYEDRIRRLVLAGIPGLAAAPPSAVSIVFVPASDPEEPVTPSRATAAHGPVKDTRPPSGIVAVVAGGGIVAALSALAWSMHRGGGLDWLRSFTRSDARRSKQP